MNDKTCVTTPAEISKEGEVRVPVRTLGYLLVAHYGERLDYLIRGVLP